MENAVRPSVSTLADILPGACSPLLDLLFAQSYRLHLLTYHFFERINDDNHSGFVQIHSAACSFLETLAAETKKSEISESCPVFIERTVTLAAFSILKICRSNLANHFKPEMSENAYFGAILFSRRASLQNDDLGARGVALMSQLWTSKHIFQHADGSMHSLGTRIRSRLSMSVVFDCFWWWREEFAGQPSPYHDESPETSPSRKSTIYSYHLLKNLLTEVKESTVLPVYVRRQTTDPSGLSSTMPTETKQD